MPIELKDYETIWLRGIDARTLAALPLDPREMMVALRDDLPRGFQPTDVNPQASPTLVRLFEGLHAIGDSGASS